MILKNQAQVYLDFRLYTSLMLLIFCDADWFQTLRVAFFH